MSQAGTPDQLGAALQSQDIPCPQLATSSGVARSTRRDWMVVAITAVALVLIILAIHRVSPRSYVGFHGPTHTAITFSVMRGNIPPTNPLAADLPLPYYWGYHVVLAGIVKVIGCPPIAAAEGVNIAAIIALTLLFCALARRYVGDVRAGILAVVIVLFAMNPLGPMVTLYRILDGTVGTSIGAFTRSPTHPVLRAMFPNNDIRWTGAFFFFMQPSSRPLAMTAGLLTAALVCKTWSHGSLPKYVAIALAAGLSCAMQPIVGTGTVFSLSVGLFAVWWLRRRNDAVSLVDTIRIVACLGIGALIAFPTYQQLLNGDLVGLPLENSVADLAVKWLLVFALYGIIPLALTAIAARRGLLARPELQVLAIAGVTLVLTSWITRVPAHREHSFFNMGMFMLALPAAAACGWAANRERGERVAHPRTFWRAVGAIVPVGLVMIGSFLYRRPIPVESNGMLISDPRDADRVVAYGWIAANTEPDALVVFDTRNGEQSAYYGVESDIPSMTNRFLLVDMIEWFTPNHPEIAQRTAIASTLFDGEQLDGAQRALLDRLNKPLYALARSPEESEALATTAGEPMFSAGNYTLFKIR